MLFINYLFLESKSKLKCLTSLIALLILIPFVITGCVNKIDEQPAGSSERIPLRFSATVEEFSTRASDCYFTEKEILALFVHTGNASDSHTLFKNIPLKMRGDNIFYPASPLYYPSSGEKINISCYYPFTKEAGSADAIPVSVSSEQNKDDKFKRSDFLAAQNRGLQASAKPIEIKFEHKLCKISLVVKASEGNIQEIANGNPEITASGLPRKAEYSITENRFSNYSNKGDIVPNGEWYKEGSCLKGKSLIVMPCEVEDNSFYFTVAINGNLFTCNFPPIRLAPASHYEFVLDCTEMSGGVIAGAIAVVEDWGNPEKVEIVCNRKMSAIPLSSLSFHDSYIYTVYAESQPRYALCREYLNASGLQTTGVVAYPVKDGGRMDMSSGILLRLPEGDNSPVCGGKICWNSPTDFTFVPGRHTSPDMVYLTSDGKLSAAPVKGAEQVVLQAYCLHDYRGGTQQRYPLTKIGTEIWMSKPLSTNLYTDGTPMEYLQELNGSAGYGQNKGCKGYYYYSGEAVTSGRLLPSGWVVPDTLVIDNLKRYLGEECDKLLFRPSEIDKESSGPSQTGMDLVLCGQLSDSRIISTQNTSPCWCRLPGSNKLPEKMLVYVLHKKKGWNYINTCSVKNGKYKALTVRAVKQREE